LQAVRQLVPDEPVDPWRNLVLIGSKVPSAADAAPSFASASASPESQVRRVLAGGVSADLVDPDQEIPLDQDHLDVSTYVTMLAAVAARSDTPLPRLDVCGHEPVGEPGRRDIRTVGRAGRP
jgi:hypothetical protein